MPKSEIKVPSIKTNVNCRNSWQKGMSRASKCERICQFWDSNSEFPQMITNMKPILNQKKEKKHCNNKLKHAIIQKEKEREMEREIKENNASELLVLKTFVFILEMVEFLRRKKKLIEMCIHFLLVAAMYLWLLTFANVGMTFFYRKVDRHFFIWWKTLLNIRTID